MRSPQAVELVSLVFGKVNCTVALSGQEAPPLIINGAPIQMGTLELMGETKIPLLTAVTRIFQWLVERALPGHVLTPQDLAQGWYYRHPERPQGV